ncbi:MAG: DMT family transporter [Phyllobacterium sp.]
MATTAAGYDTSSFPVTGHAGALLTVFIWATWIIATRHSAGTQLGTIDLGLLRYGLPALVLAPVWWRTGLLPRTASPVLLLIMVCGAGVVFFQITAFAIHSTPAAAVGVLLCGSMPLAAAMMGIVLFGERPDFTHWLGLAAIVTGLAILLVVALAGHDIALVNFLLLPVGGLLWAGYTHAFKRSGLSALQGAALIAAWSFLAHGLLAVLFGSSILVVPPREIGLQILGQGVLSGLASTLAYGFAVRSLGGSRAAAYGALAPVLAALGGAIFLDEPVGVWEITAAVVTGLGVALASGVVSHRRKR